MQNFVFFNASNESDNSDSEQNCLLQNYYSRQLTPELSAEIKTTLLTNECRSSTVYPREANNMRNATKKTIDTDELSENCALYCSLTELLM